MKAVDVGLAANKNKMIEYKPSIEAKDVDALATVMNANTRLILCKMNIGNEDMRFIATVLHSNKTITSVNFAHNKIGDDGAKEIATALDTNKSVTTLNLGHNDIGDDGALALANMLMTNESITYINLSTNKIGDDGAKDIAIALGTNTCVTTLNLTDNAIGNDGASVLADVLVKNKTSMNVRLSGNYFASILAAHDDPRMWAISFEDLLMVNDQAKELFKGNFEGKTMRDVNDKIIIPVCQKEKKSYALSKNECGLKTDVFVSHSWDERFGDFVDCIKQAYQNKLRKPNLWICAFGLLQGNPEEIKIQLGMGQGALDQSPFVRALKGASNYLVVRNCNTDLCARIWCILEFVYAKEFELIPDKTIVTGPDTFANTNISCSDAESFDPSDKEKILKELMEKSSVNEINEYIKEFRAFGSSQKTAETEVRTTPHDELKMKDEELEKMSEELIKT